MISTTALLTGLAVSVGSTVLLGGWHALMAHLTAKSHDKTIQAVVSKVTPVADASLQAGIDAGTKALASGASPQQAAQAAGVAAAAHAAASVLPQTLGPAT